MEIICLHLKVQVCLLKRVGCSSKGELFSCFWFQNLSVTVCRQICIFCANYQSNDPLYNNFTSNLQQTLVSWSGNTNFSLETRGCHMVASWTLMEVLLTPVSRAGCNWSSLFCHIFFACLVFILYVALNPVISLAYPIGALAVMLIHIIATVRQETCETDIPTSLLQQVDLFTNTLLWTLNVVSLQQRDWLICFLVLLLIGSLKAGSGTTVVYGVVGCFHRFLFKILHNVSGGTQ